MSKTKQTQSGSKVSKGKGSYVIASLVMLIIFFLASIDWPKAINVTKSFISRNPAILFGLCTVGLLAFGVLILIVRRTNAKHDALYDEMQSSLRSVLIPFGFKEKQSEGHMRHPTVLFSKGKMSAVLSQERIAHCVTGSSKESLEERQARIDDFMARADSLNDDEFLDEMEELENEENDFVVRGNITDPEFKANVLAELNKWLFRQGFR